MRKRLTMRLRAASAEATPSLAEICSRCFSTVRNAQYGAVGDLGGGASLNEVGAQQVQHTAVPLGKGRPLPIDGDADHQRGDGGQRNGKLIGKAEGPEDVGIQAN